jgi:hypothetical protein
LADFHFGYSDFGAAANLIYRGSLRRELPDERHAKHGDELTAAACWPERRPLRSTSSRDYA